MSRNHRRHPHSHPSPYSDFFSPFDFEYGVPREGAPSGTTNNFTQVFTDPQQMFGLMQEAMSTAMAHAGMNGGSFQGYGIPGYGFPGEGIPGEGFPGEGFPGEGFPGRGFRNDEFDASSSRHRFPSPSSDNSASSGSSAYGFGNRRSGERASGRDAWTRDPRNPFTHGAANYYAWQQGTGGGNPRWTMAEERRRYGD